MSVSDENKYVIMAVAAATATATLLHLPALPDAPFLLGMHMFPALLALPALLDLIVLLALHDLRALFSV
jgi:hypothetical protein